MIWRKKKEPKEIPSIQVNHNIPGISHTIRIIKNPDPRPTMYWLTLTNSEGQQYRTSPSYINGKRVIPTHFPLAWYTGRIEDSAKNCTLQIELDY